MAGNGSDQLPDAKPFQAAAPVADFRFPETIHAGEPVSFQCVSHATKSEIGERLWDFEDGIPEVTPAPKHSFEKPGKHRVTLIVWDAAGRGGRAERTIEVLPKERVRS
jgi:PKD repeat protein